MAADVFSADQPSGIDKSESLRAIPPVSALVDIAKQAGHQNLDDAVLARAIQRLLDNERALILAGATRSRADIVQTTLRELATLDRPRLSQVINATGILIHTNLGRAPVSVETARAMAEAASSYVALEIDAETNERGGRMREVAWLLHILTGAEDALVVNNNAAAVLLVLSAVAAGRSVAISRGEAVEIGGGFRVPDVLRQSGARLVEVGTTNRTYPADYEEVIDETTAALLKVHPSNFRLTGFVRSTSISELARIAARRDIPVIEDLGSGALLDTSRYRLAPEPTIRDSLQDGASLVMASGDKLLGGPQAGIIAGERTWVEKVARHPLARAVRADKTCLAGIAATLRHYARGEAEQRIPIWRMISATTESIEARANVVATALKHAGVDAAILPTEAAIGGGSLPGQTLKSAAISLRAPSSHDLARRLRLGDPPVFGRIEDERVLLDLRAVLPEHDSELQRAVVGAIAKSDESAQS